MEQEGIADGEQRTLKTKRNGRPIAEVVRVSFQSNLIFFEIEKNQTGAIKKPVVRIFQTNERKHR